MSAAAEDRDFVLSLPWADAGLEVLSARRLQVRNDSAIDVVTVACGSAVREVIVKQHRIASQDGRPASELARHEYEILSMLRGELQDASDGSLVCAVPAPLFVDIPRCTVVMERATGTPLDRIISASRRRLRHRRLVAPLQSAGSWLRQMQLHSREDADGRMLLGQLLEGSVRDLSAMASKDAAVRDRQQTIERRLRELHACASRRAQPLAGRHGDYWPGNVFVSPGRVEVIDFEGFAPGHPLQDVAYFLAYLERLPLASVDFRYLRSAFLAGYSASEKVDDIELEFLRLVDSIHALTRPLAVVSAGFRGWISLSPRTVTLRAGRS